MNRRRQITLTKENDEYFRSSRFMGQSSGINHALDFYREYHDILKQLLGGVQVSQKTQPINNDSITKQVAMEESKLAITEEPTKEEVSNNNDDHEMNPDVLNALSKFDEGF